MTEKIDKTIERIAKTFSGLHLSETHLKGILIGFKNEVREQTVKEVIEKIKKYRDSVALRHGTHKYDSCYDDCINILEKYDKSLL